MGFGNLKRRNRKTAHATVVYTSAVNDDGNKQICVYAKCHLSDHVAGPVWGHGEESVRRVLATLTQECDCPAKFHKAREYSGKKVTSTKK